MLPDSITRPFFKNLPSTRFLYYGCVLRVLIKNLSDHKCLLLIAGCGGSIVGVSMEQVVNGAETIGVDISRANVQASKRHLRHTTYVVADLTHLPFRDKVFSGVVCINVIEHIDNKKAVAYEFARSTREGGFFVGSTTNLFNPALCFDAKMPIIAKFVVAKFFWRPL